MMKLYFIEPINGDNWRPGTHKEGFIVYYRPHIDFGWTGRRSFKTREEAEQFASTLINEM
jgi:hypothetical protein